MITAQMLQHNRTRHRPWALGSTNMSEARGQFEELRGCAMMEMQNAVMVVAHPDDEILWFSSILRQCKRVLVCFGASATSTESWDDGRAVMMDTYPLSKVRFLRLRQSDAFEASNWNKPREADCGLQLPRRKCPLYEKNAEELLQLLAVELRHERVVVTHNPWGEYGNEEHVQVFRVLTELKEKIGFDLYVDGYVSDRSAKLMSRSAHALEGNPLVYKTNRALAHALRNQYLKNDCWTWMVDYVWPSHESFYRVAAGASGDEAGIPVSIPLNYITYNFNRSPIRKIVSKTLPASVKLRMKRVGHV
ncbi:MULTISPECIES: PIG-L family deacetylase [unclassified Mycolicibacterium]|uniref:PIG-L family deacetylase n=1 Tax=unclassified Mycolicibacterium TaxID=2636767 RepID=UPI001EE49B43|nr:MULTISPECIES: PIG-L family deacetylase [unclassified Mycolicibacterium]